MDSSLSWHVVPKQAVITYLIKLWRYPPTSGITYCQREGNLKGKCWGLSEILWRQCSDSRGEKGRQYPTLRVISNTLRSMRHDKNIAPAEDFIMRDRLLFSLGEKKLLPNSICLVYIYNEPNSVWSCYCLGSVWREGQLFFQSFSPEDFPCWIHSDF